MVCASLLALEQEVVKGLYVFKGSLPSGADVTASILASEGEAIFFDSLYYPRETLRLIEIADNEELDPIALVNTHWHVDHTAGNNNFTVRTISDTRCPDLMKTDLPKQMENAKEKIGDVQIKYPDSTFENELHQKVGDKQVKLVHLPGHTPDSIVGLVEEDQLLIAGDTVMTLPYVAYGNSEALLDSLQRIKSWDVKVIVQGHGEVCNKDKLDLDIQYLERVRDVLAERINEGAGPEKIQSLRIQEFIQEDFLVGMPSLYKERIHKANLERIYQELSRRANETR